MKETNYDYINSIQTGTLIYGDGWANGKVGFFKDFDNKHQLRFIEDQGKYRIGRDWTDDDKLLPVLAQGFVAWLIKNWGADTLFTYSEYLQIQLKHYKSEHKNDPDVFMRNLEREFYSRHKTQEEELVKQSEAIFDFISELEINKVKEYIHYYFEYVNNVCNPIQTTNNISEAQIRKLNKSNSKFEIKEGQQQKRIINSEKLKEFFIPQFKGAGNGNLNHFDTLISELETDRSAKQFAEIALMIFESDKLNRRRPPTFKKWYGLFCDCIGCESKTYEPKDLRKPKENLKKLFGYL